MNVANQSMLVRPLQRPQLAVHQIPRSIDSIQSMYLSETSAYRRLPASVSCSAGSMDAPSRQASRQYESLKGSMVCLVQA